jgi:hypothetical protein
MAARTPARRSASSRMSALSRSRSDDDPVLVEARQALRVAGLSEYIQRVVDTAPPLTQAQRDKLALLLRGAVQ